MKIGIITFWESDDNYGQVLQCWALQHYLKSLGHQPYLIKYERYEQPPALTMKQIAKNALKQVIKCMLVVPYLKTYRRKKQERAVKHYYELRNQERAFQQFKNNEIDSTELVYTIDQLKKIPPKADAYITGSDQVWYYMDNSRNMQAYYLQFGDSSTIKISYAPSIGSTTFPDEKIDIVRRYLAGFKAISVREKSSMPIIKKMGYHVEQVVDPTFLLTANRFESIIENKRNNNPYIFIYSLNYQSRNDIPWENIKSLADRRGMEIVVTPASGYLPVRELFDGVTYDYATIGGWLNNIRNAELVITSSFHGIIFSLLFHKNFIFIPLKGWMEKSNNRVIDLLDDIELQQQVWDEQKTIDYYLSSFINWEEVDNSIKEKRNNSFLFLKKNLYPEQNNN